MKHKALVLFTSAAIAGYTPQAQDLTGHDLGTSPLTPGSFSSSGQQTVSHFLKDPGDPRFVFQLERTLTSASTSSARSVNCGSPEEWTVFWQVVDSATIGSRAQEHLLALTSIALDIHANFLEGNSLARTGPATLNNNALNPAIPAPATMALALLGGAMLTRRCR